MPELPSLAKEGGWGYLYRYQQLKTQVQSTAHKKKKCMIPNSVFQDLSLC